MIAKAVRSSGRILFYFTCYGYSKGKCAAKTSVAATKLEPAVLSSIQEAFQAETFSYSNLISPRQPESTSAEQKRINDLIHRVTFKEQRARDAYINGIDTMEEYKKNKLRLQEERQRLEEKLALLSPIKPNLSPSEVKQLMQKRLKSVYDVLLSNADIPTKNSTLKNVVEKIIYNKETDTVKLYYYS